MYGWTIFTSDVSAEEVDLTHASTHKDGTHVLVTGSYADYEALDGFVFRTTATGRDAARDEIKAKMDELGWVENVGL